MAWTKHEIHRFSKHLQNEMNTNGFSIHIPSRKKDGGTMPIIKVTKFDELKKLINIKYCVGFSVTEQNCSEEDRVVDFIFSTHSKPEALFKAWEIWSRDGQKNAAKVNDDLFIMFMSEITNRLKFELEEAFNIKLVPSNLSS